MLVVKPLLGEKRKSSSVDEPVVDNPRIIVKNREQRSYAMVRYRASSSAHIVTVK